MSMINRVVLIGRLTKEVEVKKTSTGISVCSFTLAVNGRDKNKEADFINCQAWRQSADFLGSYAHKGSTVALDGRLQTRHYTGKDGMEVYLTEAVADNVSLLDNSPKIQPQTAKAQPNDNASQYGSYSANDLDKDLPW